MSASLTQYSTGRFLSLDSRARSLNLQDIQSLHLWTEEIKEGSSFSVGRVQEAVPGYHHTWEVCPALSGQERRIHHAEGVDDGAWLAREWVGVIGKRPWAGAGPRKRKWAGTREGRWEWGTKDECGTFIFQRRWGVNMAGLRGRWRRKSVKSDSEE